MICSKCGSKMSEVGASYGETVHRCETCKGLFVGEEALALMQREWFLWPASDSGRVDSGNPAIGRQYDAVVRVDCPACGSRMSAISPPDQPHIWLERCSNCKGVFFDAGELTDLRYKTLADWVRDFLKPARPA